MSHRVVAWLALSATSAMAFVPAAAYRARCTTIINPGDNLLTSADTFRLGRVSMESTERMVELDEETVKAVAAAASVDAQQQRVDDALAELKRSGDAARAAAVGGFLTTPVEQPFNDVADPVPVWLSVAPPVIGGFSVVLFVLNTFGVFGEGPDLNTLG